MFNAMVERRCWEMPLSRACCAGDANARSFSSKNPATRTISSICMLCPARESECWGRLEALPPGWHSTAQGMGEGGTHSEVQRGGANQERLKIHCLGGPQPLASAVRPPRAASNGSHHASRRLSPGAHGGGILGQVKQAAGCRYVRHEPPRPLTPLDRRIQRPKQLGQMVLVPANVAAGAARLLATAMRQLPLDRAERT